MRQRLSSRVVSVLGMNPGPFTLGGTNTYLVGTGASRLLIDCGGGAPTAAAYVDNLASAMAEQEVDSLQAILLTHWHHDHTGGIAAVLERWPGTPLLKLIPSAMEEEEAYDEESGGAPDFAPFGHSYCALSSSELITTEGASLRVIRTPGHTLDHISLYCEEDGTLIAGDCILGGTDGTIFSNLAAYLTSLRKLLGMRPVSIYPGHGSFIEDGVAAIEKYIAHREKRIEQVRAALSTEARTLTAIVETLYPELEMALIPAATNNTRLVLRALAQEGSGAAATCLAAEE